MTYTRLGIQEENYLVPKGMQFRKWKRFHWLESLARKLWGRLSEPHMEKQAHYKTVTVEHETIQDLIAEQKENLYRIYGGDACRHVIVGPKQFYGIQNEIAMASFGMNVRLGLDRGPPQMFGLTVHCVPWFDGVLVVPELKTHATPQRHDILS